MWDDFVTQSPVLGKVLCAATDSHVDDCCAELGTPVVVDGHIFTQSGSTNRPDRWSAAA